MMEMQIILATLMQRFRFSLIPGSLPEAMVTLTIRPRDGLWMIPELAPDRTLEDMPMEVGGDTAHHGECSTDVRTSGAVADACGHKRDKVSARGPGTRRRLPPAIRQERPRLSEATSRRFRIGNSRPTCCCR